jgi:hypothetical protein
MFFKSFGLYGQQKCELIMAAILRVVYCMFALDGTEKVKSELMRNQNDNDSEYVPEEYVVRANLSALVQSLDFQQLCGIFMVLLSQRYINENATPEFKICRPLTVELLMNMLSMATEFPNQTAYTKEVVSILECVQLHEVDDPAVLKVLWHQCNQAAKRFVKQQPKLTKFIAAIRARLEELAGPAEEPESLTEDEEQRLRGILLPIAELEAFADEVEKKKITLPEEDPTHLHTLREGLFAINQEPK